MAARHGFGKGKPWPPRGRGNSVCLRVHARFCPRRRGGNCINGRCAVPFSHGDCLSHRFRRLWILAPQRSPWFLVDRGLGVISDASARPTRLTRGVRWPAVNIIGQCGRSERPSPVSRCSIQSDPGVDDRRALGRAIAELELAAYACPIMPDHVHLVTGRYRSTAEYVAGFLKRAATRRLSEEGLHPLQGCRQTNGRTPGPWVVGGWFVYLNRPEEVHRRIRYVDENPTKAGLPPQRWSFVRPYGM